MRDPNFSFTSPAGPIHAYITRNGLQELHLGFTHTAPAAMAPVENAAIAQKLALALGRYFRGKPESFVGIPLDFAPATPFRLQVWRAARKVAWGKTCSYADLSVLLGRDRGSARAVGQALGANPIPILVPCHRILAAHGALGGFSCGLEWKRILLGIEGSSQQM